MSGKTDLSIGLLSLAERGRDPRTFAAAAEATHSRAVDERRGRQERLRDFRQAKNDYGIMLDPETHEAWEVRR